MYFAKYLPEYHINSDLYLEYVQLYWIKILFLIFPILGASLDMKFHGRKFAPYETFFFSTPPWKMHCNSIQAVMIFNWHYVSHLPLSPIFSWNWWELFCFLWFYHRNWVRSFFLPYVTLDELGIETWSNEKLFHGKKYWQPCILKLFWLK